jgi:uncharacterized protein with beta-barrel porin domain
MRVMATTARLLAATAICCAFSARALAQDYGLQSTDATPITNPSGSTLEGAKTGVYSTGEELNLDNAGTIRGNGLASSTFNSNGGVIISGGPAYITNGGDISGAQFGISTIYYDLGGGTFEGRAIGSTVDNSGSIIGDNNDGVRLIGGGTVTNSGYIAGRVGSGADGISIFPYTGQDTSALTSIGSVTNLAGGLIEGNRFGVIIFGPGSVDNAGTIDHTVSIQGSANFAPEQFAPGQTGTVNNSGIVINGGIVLASLDTGIVTNSGHTPTVGFAAVTDASLTNSGTIDYFASFSTVGTAEVNNSGSIGEGLIFNKTATANVINSGTITATDTPDVVGTTRDAVYSEAALTLTNTATGTIEGFASGIRSNGASLTLDNAGTIRGNGNQAFFGNSAAGVTLQGGPGFITNSGSISGQQFGITTIYVTTDPFLGLAIGSTVDNSGSIIGDNNDGARLIGGGTVTNSGYIAGRLGAGADGISMFSFEGQDLTSFDVIGSVTNTATGVIDGNRFGIILSNGGNVDNAGTISGNAGSILIQAQGVGPEPERTATVTNSGTLNGTVQFNEVVATLDNSGTISSATAAGTYATGSSGSLSATNHETGSITGATSGIIDEASSFTLVNQGTIRGNGNSTAFNSPDAGVLITGGPADITNSGTISGQQFGISTFDFLVDPATFEYQGRAIGTTVANTGTIIGEHNDGVRLIGGGTVTNSGYIAGRAGPGADGVSMFAYEDQDTTSLPSIGTVNNLAGGVIEGNRFGIILSGGGEINNAGTINGGTNGAILIQTRTDDDHGRTGTITNSGDINGLVQFFALENASVVNSGSISNGSGQAIYAAFRTGDLSVTNEEGGSIEGAKSGIFSQAETFSLVNHGTIRGNGTFDGFGDTPDAGVTVSGGPATIENYGSITGQRFGITTIYNWDDENQLLQGLAIGSTVENHGTIIGDTDIGIRLIGGGTVINDGYIAGRLGVSADGVWMMAFDGQPLDGFDVIGSVINLAGGVIEGDRRGVTLANGGTVDNAGTISGDVVGIRIVALANDPGRTGAVTNSGTINGGVELIGLADATVDNSGSILRSSGAAVDVAGGASVVNSGSIINSGTAAGTYAIHMTGAGSVTNLAGGIVQGFQGVILDHGGTVDNAGTIGGDVALFGGPTGTITNSGTINGYVVLGSTASTLINSGTINTPGGSVIFGWGQTNLVNSGTINGGTGTAVGLSLANDTVTLLTGSSISGSVYGNSGIDTVNLSGTMGSPTALQTVGNFLSFENLNVLGGYWTAPGNTGTFNSTVISGGTLAVNGTLTSPVGINAGAVLGGTGTITGNVTVNSGGALNPGNGVGTINVTGNVMFGSGSVFRLDALPTGTADKLAVSGTVTIGSGSTLQVLGGAGTWSPKTSYTVLTANSISGKFSTVTSNLAFLSPQLATKSQSIVLTLTRNGKPITSAATAETFSTASAISGLSDTNPIMAAILFQSEDGARQAFSALSGASYDRLDALLADGFGQLDLGFDAQASAPVLSWTGADPLQARGFHSGSAFSRGPLSVMAIGGAYKRHLSAENTSADVETRFLANAVGYRTGRFQALAGLTTAWHDGTISRIVSFPGFFEQTRARELTETRKLEGRISYALATGSVGVVPYAALSNLTIRTHAFEETGGYAALSFDKGTRSLTEAELGLRVRGQATFAGFAVAPHLDLSLLRRWGDLDSRQSARFASGSEAFDSVGSGFDSRQVAVGAGVDLTDGPLAIGASYKGRIGDRWEDHSALLSATLRF